MVLSLLVAGCGVDGGVRVEGPAPSARPGPVYVMAYMGHPLQRPERFALSEFSSMAKVRWRSWGGGSAVGVGELSGTWCLPGCEKNGIPATITLSGLEWQERVGYYSRFDVQGRGVPQDLVDQKLEVPRA
ncbi:hypothetical protein GCM10010176_071590 [Nonomuraea spiralis]|nr:hypothetical protein GCM10010176_071590 [Nonomuraea spiralis]